MLLGVDVGGTFTDAVLVVDGRAITAKAPSTPEDQSRGVLDAVRAALERAGRDAREVTAFAHGMTVATNALLEGRAARTVLIATEGFTDVVELGRQRRRDLYRLCAAHPPPLVAPELRVAAPERTGPEGVLRALDDPAAVARAALAHEPEAVAVCLLHADRFPEHERALGEALAAAAPGVHVSLSHDVVGTFREYERAATTEVDAALSPLLARYLRELVRAGSEEGLPEPAIMQSSGGLADAELAARHAALSVLSGPAGGAAAAALIAERTGVPDLLCFDMGGTSCDVCVVEGGRVRETAGREVGGRPLTLPMVDIHTVGAGGGSIGWIDPGGALRVGPRSAGADPGPACYGRGGTEPTVTDANLVLGLLDRDTPLAGGVALDADAAERALETLGMEAGEAARGIVRVANAEMVRALRVMTVERGVDPRGFALLAFGGAGGLHAAAIADELGIDRIVCPRASGVLSALGLAAADRRVDVQRTVLGRDYDAEELAADARERIGDGRARTEVVYDCRFRGQSFELTVSDPRDFPKAHEERYGFTEPDGEVEVVTVRATARTPGADVELAAEGEAPDRGERATVLGDRTAVLRGELPPGTRVEGPAICALPEATLAVPAGWAGAVDDHGTVVLDRSR
ncbi:MAG TPA: hydantoinase/oxoprolinase family protein [Solirubrobacteraceae bacterium]|nr:hydantoinase/oxoprolinase family protein [Solirubrobacteraceae bacterium]